VLETLFTGSGIFFFFFFHPSFSCGMLIKNILPRPREIAPVNNRSFGKQDFWLGVISRKMHQSPYQRGAEYVRQFFTVDAPLSLKRKHINYHRLLVSITVHVTSHLVKFYFLFLRCTTHRRIKTFIYRFIIDFNIGNNIVLILVLHYNNVLIIIFPCVTFYSDQIH